MKIVFSIDGGGIRGVIPARVLVAIEEAVGRPLHQVVDLVGGTSTGGIIALAIAAGIPAADMVRLYAERGPAIFKPPGALRRLRGWGWRTAQAKYPSGPLEAELRAVFGDTCLGEALIPAFVTAYALEEGRALKLRSWAPGAQARPMWQAAMATSAAPTYFAPFDGFWDGGVFANNPVRSAWRWARALWPREEIYVASFGTGTGKLSIDPRRALSKTQVATVILDVMMDGQADDAAAFLEGLEVPELAGYLRLQASLRHGSQALDDASSDNLFRLQLDADEMLKQREIEFADLVEVLRAAGAARAAPERVPKVGGAGVDEHA